MGGCIARSGTPGSLAVGTGGSAAFSWTSNPVATSKALVAVWTGSAVTLSGVSDNGVIPATWVLDATETNGNAIAYLYRADDITLPSSGDFTVTVTGTSGHAILAGGIAYTGVKPGGPTATNVGDATGASVSSNSVTPAASGALSFSVFADATTSAAESISLTNANFTQQYAETNGSADHAGAAADFINPALPTATACTWTLGDSVAWACVIAAYDAVPSGTVLPGEKLTAGLLGMPPWTPMTLLNSWESFGSSGGMNWVYAQYRQWPLTNQVQLVGEISGGTIANGTGIWQAPSAYIPASEQAVCPVTVDGDAGGGGSASAFTPRVVINSSGLLFLENLPAGTSSIGLNGFYSLDA